MDVKTLCLGLLSLNEACGYELKKNVESIFNHFFAAGYGSIYPALADLTEAGFVDCREVPQNGRPVRKVYAITESGRRHFQNALDTQNPAHKLRSDFLVMMYFADQLDADRLKRLLDERIEAFHDTKAHIDGITQSRADETPAGTQFVAGFGKAMSEAAARYIEEHRHLLEDESKARHKEKHGQQHESVSAIEERA
jgi:PadR family transcriptional regulator AphA